MPIDYPSGISEYRNFHQRCRCLAACAHEAPPPPNFMQRRKEQYERLRASINRERLNDFHVKAMELIECKPDVHSYLVLAHVYTTQQ